MAQKLIKFQNDEGEILVAVKTSDDMVQAVGRLDDTIEAVGKSFSEALQVVTDVSKSFEAVFKGIKAESAEIELGFQCTAKGNIYIVEAQGQSSIKVKLLFKRTTPPSIS